MIWFLVIALVLVAVALLWILPGLLRRRHSGAGLAAEASNLAVLRDQLGELDRDVANGTLSQQQYDQARSDIERRVLEDTGATVGMAVAQPGNARWTALALALGIPLFAGLLYFQIGNPDAMSFKAADGGGHKITAQDVEAMTARLAARLKEAPDDGNGWALLGRSYMMMQRFDDASAAYARATALIKDDADLLADYADALGMQQGRRLDGRPLQLVERALKIDPGHWKALAMAGSAAFERKDYRKAVDYWEKLQGRAGLDADFARTIAANIDEARQLGGIKAQAAPKSATAATPAPAVAAASGANVRGSVSLAAALAGKAAPSDTVFIFARAAEGSRMPLAILRMQVKDLPATFTLDDSQAMTPEMKLSNFAEVVVSARISKSAGATLQSGDLQGFSQKLKPGATAVKIVIDQIVP